MKVIRFWTTHPDKHPARWLSNFELDSKEFALVYDRDHPDYLFVTEHIFVDDLQKKRLRRLVRTERRVLIYYADECIFPDMNLFDYAVTFDRGIVLEDRIIRRHPISFVSELFRHSMSFYRERRVSSVKQKFCNFIYSNPNAHPRRDEIFRLVSRYRKVDSLGPHLNNVGNVPSRGSTDWGDLLIELKRPYKFSIACENARYRGYLTEKLISSFMAQTVPIYWGDPDCSSEFNPNAFIDASNLSDEKLLARIEEIDRDDDLWLQMVSEPPMTDEQIAKYEEQDLAYRSFMARLFSMPVEDAKRVPVGFWTENYARYFWEAKGVPITRRERVFAQCGRATEFADWIIHYFRRD